LNFTRGLVLLAIASATASNAANTLSLTPFSCCDGQFITTNARGQTVWQNVSGSAYLDFIVPASFAFTSGAPVYVQAVYYDEGDGRIDLEYDSVTGYAYAKSLLHTRTSRMNTKTFATAYYVVQSPAFLKRQGTGADFRLGLSASPPISVRSCTIQNFAFTNAQFQFLLARPWLKPYSGPTRTEVDRSTLRNKAMAGYQGWFRAPNDLADEGWMHWVRNSSMAAINFSIDMWPDMLTKATSRWSLSEACPFRIAASRRAMPTRSLISSRTTPCMAATM